jgi:hypothetical protein
VIAPRAIRAQILLITKSVFRYEYSTIDRDGEVGGRRSLGKYGPQPMP